ncbi:NAD-dependent epimerase/dehydratase family protein [Streptomyces sp. NPDC002790]|uniref:NAD-dependent epimerase/dehydratase family protein n=1 Tax=unclassified Streptomyces TaxID=2593676 RepID=UPI00331AF3C3
MADRVLITGGAGFIGLHLIRRLLDQGCEITALDDFSRGKEDPEFAALAKDFRLVRHDLTRPVPDGLLDGSFDAVYHLAAVVGVQRTQSAPAHVLRTNLLTTVNLLDWCDRNPPGAVFLSSTSEVGDGAAQLGVAPFPTPENAPFALVEPRRPRSSYALSKVASESMLWLRQDSYKVRIARYYNVYGPRMGHSHVIPQLIGRIADGVDPFPLYGAEQSRAFCYVDDAVRASVGLMALPTDAPVLANIGNDTEEIRIENLARRLFRLAGVAPALAAQAAPPGSPERRLPDLTTLRSVLPSLEYTPLDTGLRAMLDWYGANRPDRPAVR